MVEKYKEYYQRIGQNLHDLRKTKNLSQDDVANKCETVDRAKISKMENGRVDYMLSTLLEVCDALDEDISNLVKRR